MSVVPSHDCFLNGLCGHPCLRSVHVISQPDPALTFIDLLSQGFPTFSCRTIHPPANVIGHAIHSRAQQGGTL